MLLTLVPGLVVVGRGRDAGGGKYGRRMRLGSNMPSYTAKEGAVSVNETTNFSKTQCCLGTTQGGDARWGGRMKTRQRMDRVTKKLTVLQIRIPTQLSQHRHLQRRPVVSLVHVPEQVYVCAREVKELDEEGVVPTGKVSQ
jgi:hypothetical protein